MSLACACYCYLTFPPYSNRQRDKEWQWHGTRLLVPLLMCVHGKGKGFHSNWMHDYKWKLQCCNACKAMKQWFMMVTSCAFLEGWIHR